MERYARWIWEIEGLGLSFNRSYSLWVNTFIFNEVVREYFKEIGS